MKRNMFMAAGTALLLALLPNNSQAQDAAPVPATGQPNPALPPGAPPANSQPMPAPGPRPRPMPMRVRQPRIFIQRALADLRMVKSTLQQSQDDFGGHKESAIAAVVKAEEELNEVMKAMPKPVPPQRPPSQFQNNQNNLRPVTPSGANPQPAPPPSIAPQP